MRGRGAFYRVRVAVLLAVLFVVVLYAAKDLWRRRARNSWARPLNVALVVVRDGEVNAAAISALTRQTRTLEALLRDQFRRYRDGGMKPFEFTVYGPVDASGPVPHAATDGVIDLAKHAWALHRFTSDLDQHADVPSTGFDACVYLVVRQPARADRALVEGQSEQGGRIAIAQAELDETMAPLALFVATHELLHTLGATDKYDAAGRIRVPSGLAEPELVPIYPQRYAEVMARNRAFAPGVEEPPATLAELAVGRETAIEIGWSEAR